MKINNLLEIISTSTKERSVSGKFKSDDWEVEDDQNEREKGRSVGRFSTVKPGSDPHTVKKSSKVPGMDTIDGYWTFIDYVIKYKLWENPHFPRVYSIKKIKDSTGDLMFRGEIEKLEPLKELNLKEIEHLFERIFGQDGLPTLMQNTAGLDSSELKKAYIDRFAKDIEQISKGITKLKIVDDSFKKAIKILQMIRKKEKQAGKKSIRGGRGLIYDIHSENIMVRRTPYGLQLVFTDPFL